MVLTAEDLTNITNIVEGAIGKAVEPLATKAELKVAVSGLATREELDAKLNAAVAGLATKADLDRMEARLTTSIGLLERDSFSRLDQHEARITRLEQARP